MSFKSFKSKLIILLVIVIVFLLVSIISFHSLCLNNNSEERKRCPPSYESKSDPTIYVITPTYDRLVQKAELIRLSHTLLLVNNIHWILVEDSEHKTQFVTKFLTGIQNYGHLPYTHLNVETPKQFKMKSTDPNWLKPRGVLQRNLALNWIRDNANEIDRNGILYFADDDNTYDLRLFEEMRSTKKVSVWPVGLVGGLIVEKPIVENGKVIGWNTMWKKQRQFPIDMSGFAVSLRHFLKNSRAMFSLDINRGYQETYFLKNLIDTIDELEPKANDCSEIYIWHTRTERPDLKQEIKLKKPSNDGMEL